MLDQWAEIVLRNAAWTMGWVVAAVLLFMLFVAAIGGGAGNGNANRQMAKGHMAKPQGRCSASVCPRCARRYEAFRDERIRQLAKVLKDTAPAEPRRSRRVGAPNPRAGEPATGRRVDQVA